VLKKSWPYPVVELFLDQKLPDEARRAAGENADYKCEANFYIGEWLLLKQRQDEALSEFAEASKNCRKEFIEYLGAEAERKRN